MPPTTMQSFGTSERSGHQSDKFYSRKLYDTRDEPIVQHKGANGEGANGEGVNGEHRSLPKKLTKQSLNKVYCHSSERMDELPDDSIHLMITSPPYNVGKDYDDDLTMPQYLGLLSRVFTETYRVLVPGGRACINIANLGRKPYIPLNAIIAQVMQEIGYLMRGEIIWNKSASAGTSCAWGSWCSPSNPVLRDTHEYILVFCKENYSRSDEGGEKTIKKDDFLNATKSIWEFPAESAKRVQHPAPFPVELPRRLIELYTYSNDIVLDPFMGSGTTAVAANMTTRRWVGYDTSEEYVKIAHARLELNLPAGIHAAGLC